MRIIRLTDLQQTPWKNGGGITREIAIAQAGDALIWRLSIADVGIDGPFSRFDGLSRILTVIEGRGMELISRDATLQADYAVPVSFDGALEIQTRLKDGPLRDLNLIYNPSFCTGHAQVITAASKHLVEAKLGRIVALHCMNGSVTLGETELLHKGDTALIEGDAFNFTIAGSSTALMITIQTEANS
jgi:environmental stress-induced protein Ves